MTVQASHHRNRSRPSVRGVALLGAGTALTYLVWLGWDRRRDVNPVTKEVSGPYEAWQIIGVVVVLALLAGVAGWLRHPLAAIVVIPVVFTVCWSVGASTDPYVVGANLWPIGAAAVALGSLFGALLVAGTAHAIRSRYDPA